MKRCPECRRDYYNDAPAYCLDDGNPLLEGPAIPADEHATVVMHRPEPAFVGLDRSVADQRLENSKENTEVVAVLPFVNLSRAEDRPVVTPLHDDPRWLPLLDKEGFPRTVDEFGAADCPI
jgi:hypothetical protein